MRSWIISAFFTLCYLKGSLCFKRKDNHLQESLDLDGKDNNSQVSLDGNGVIHDLPPMLGRQSGFSTASVARTMGLSSAPSVAETATTTTAASVRAHRSQREAPKPLKPPNAIRKDVVDWLLLKRPEDKYDEETGMVGGVHTSTGTLKAGPVKWILITRSGKKINKTPQQALKSLEPNALAPDKYEILMEALEAWFGHYALDQPGYDREEIVEQKRTFNGSTWQQTLADGQRTVGQMDALTQFMTEKDPTPMSAARGLNPPAVAQGDNAKFTHPPPGDPERPDHLREFDRLLQRR